jgi:hypothetical protein
VLPLDKPRDKTRPGHQEHWHGRTSVIVSRTWTILAAWLTTTAVGRTRGPSSAIRRRARVLHDHHLASRHVHSGGVVIQQLICCCLLEFVLPLSDWRMLVMNTQSWEDLYGLFFSGRPTTAVSPGAWFCLVGMTSAILISLSARTILCTLISIAKLGDNKRTASTYVRALTSSLCLLSYLV